MEPCLDYFIDFHRTLLPYAPKMFVARFEVVTTDFEGLILQFNARMNANYGLPRFDDRAIFSRIEEELRDQEGKVREMQVCRPSPKRAELKAVLAKELDSCATAKKLDKARELYVTLVQNNAKAMDLTSPCARLRWSRSEN